LFKENKFVNDFKYDWVQLHKENIKTVKVADKQTLLCKRDKRFYQQEMD